MRKHPIKDLTPIKLIPDEPHVKKEELLPSRPKHILPEMNHGNLLEPSHLLPEVKSEKFLPEVSKEKLLPQKRTRKTYLARLADATA